jgi:ribose transport system permease protein
MQTKNNPDDVLDQKEDHVTNKGIKRLFSKLQNVEAHWLTFAALVVFSIIFQLLSDSFLTPTNLLVVARQSSFIGMVALAQLVVLIVGGIDLSVGSVVGLSGIITAGILSSTENLFLGILVGLGVGIIIGLINGLIITRLKISDIIATLAMLFIAHGLIYAYSGGHPIYEGIPKIFNFLGQGKIGPVTMPIVFLIVIAVAISIFLNRTKYGRNLYAVGGNPEVAFRSGINTKNYKLGAYIFSGLLCGFTGVVLTSRLGSGQPATGASLMLDSVAAVILGGASLAGGAGTVTGTIIGVLVIGIMSNGLTLIGATYYTQEILKGVMLILAVLLNALRTRSRQ